MALVEVQCETCGHSYNPSGEELIEVRSGVRYYEHYGYEDSNGTFIECGGFGPVIAVYG